MAPVLVGVVIGLAGAVAAASTLHGILFEVAPTDPPSLGVVVFLLLVTSGLA